MKVAFNNLNNINFQKRFVIVGEKEQLKRADKQIKDSFVSSETLLVDNNDENALIIASDSDMTRLKMAKKRDDLGVWISKIQSLAGKNYLPALLNFLFGTNEKTALIDLDNLKGKKAAVLGTGGASRAICAGLYSKGIAEIDLYTRNVIDSKNTVETLRN